MFRRLLLALTVLLLLPLRAESADNPSELLSQCEQLIRSARVNGDGVVLKKDVPTLECWAYFSAVQDMITVKFGRGSVPALNVCAPPQSTLYEQIRVFVSYAQQNPTVLSRRTGNAVLSALMSAYPCSGQEGTR
jgi:hypothetical protein